MTSGAFAELDVQISTQDTLTQYSVYAGGAHMHGLGGDDRIAAVHQKTAHAEVASLDLAAPVAFVPENQHVLGHMVAESPHS